LLEDARAGDPVAQNGLGVMYYTGEAVSKNASGQVLDNDPELAAGWFFVLLSKVMRMPNLTWD